MRLKNPKEKQGSEGAHSHYPCQSPNITSRSANGARGLTSHVRHKKQHRYVTFAPSSKWHARGERGPSTILQVRGKTISSRRVGNGADRTNRWGVGEPKKAISQKIRKEER